MRVLAIDSSGLVATVAVAEGEHLIAEYTVDYKKTHSQTLLPMLEEIKKMINLDLSTIRLSFISPREARRSRRKLYSRRRRRRNRHLGQGRADMESYRRAA